MAALKMKAQVDVVNATGLSDSTISRVMFTVGYKPDHDTIEKLARGLRCDVEEFTRFIRSGGETPEPTAIVTGKYADLIDDVVVALGEDSPLSPDEQVLRAGMIDAIIGPVRKQLHRSARAV
jgi:transcriptional regulator with XRE-family HTH domain